VLLDRLALGLIEWAEECGKLKKGQTVVEASSGNTGILQTHTFLFGMHSLSLSITGFVAVCLFLCTYVCLTVSLRRGRSTTTQTHNYTGIGLAMVCAAKGYPFVCVMSESFSIERRKLMRFLGAKVPTICAIGSRYSASTKHLNIYK